MIGIFPYFGFRTCYLLSCLRIVFIYPEIFFIYLLCMPWKWTARFAVVNPPATSAADSRCAASLPWSLLRSMVLRNPPPAVAESPSNFRETRYPPAVPEFPSSPGARAIPPCKFAKKPPPAVTPSAPPNLSAPALTACAARLPACLCNVVAASLLVYSASESGIVPACWRTLSI